jgi:ferredoxin
MLRRRPSPLALDTAPHLVNDDVNDNLRVPRRSVAMPEPVKKVRVRVDADKCQGHNRCKALAPELFELDEYGNSRAVGDGLVPAALLEKAYLAKSNCPEFAVEIIEE